MYLTKRISVTTDTSVLGIPEGTRVDIVDRKGGRIAGQIEGMVLELREDEVTNEVDQIEAILKQRAEAEARLTKKADPLEEAGIHLTPPKPPTPEERRAARLEKLKKIQALETSVEDAKKQLSELNTLKIEKIRKSLSQAKSRDRKTGKEKPEEPDSALDASLDDLRETIEKGQKEIAELKASLGI